MLFKIVLDGYSNIVIVLAPKKNVIAYNCKKCNHDRLSRLQKINKNCYQRHNNSFYDILGAKFEISIEKYMEIDTQITKML